MKTYTTGHFRVRDFPDGRAEVLGLGSHDALKLTADERFELVDALVGSSLLRGL